MRLYIEEKVGANKTGQKRYLDKIAETRADLSRLLGGKEFYVNDQKYFVNQVKAEKATDSTALGLALGGIIGVLGGAVGVAAGGTLGAILGRDKDLKEAEKVKKFNESKM